MSSTVDHLPEAMQPIMCCLGERVAGKPTQFMWERAISAGQLDWRAITIQLASQDLSVALAGMYVMRIMGLRFYWSLQCEALRQLAADQERLQFIGRVTSAARGPDTWQAWHNWGGTILTWGAQHADLRHATCWLHGDSVECRSLWVALLEGVAAGAHLPRTVLWSEPPTNLTPRWEKGAEVHLVELESVEQALLHLQQVPGADAQRTAKQPREAQMKTGAGSHSAHTLLLVGEQLPEWDATDSELSSLAANLAESHIHCLVAGGAQAIQQAKSWPSSSLQVLSQAEQIIGCEAYDFKRWTGCAVANHVLRDAYDEYHGFE